VSARHVAVLAAALAATACARARPLWAPPDDYAGYRATRVAPTLGERVAAADRYLDEHRAGLYAAEVQRYFDEAEPLFYVSRKDSVAGLEDYLRALPDGPHAAEATRRLASLRAVAGPRTEDLVGVAEAAERRMSREATDRAEVVAEVARWVDALARPAVFAGPMSEAPGDVVIAWTLHLPHPVCEAGEGGLRTCRKLIERPYTLPGTEGLDERQATLEIVIVEDAWGRPREAAIRGPELFARLEEARSIREVPPGDAKARAKASAEAAKLVEAKAGARVDGGAGCTRAGEADLVCGGVRVIVRPGATGADDDRIEIRPQP
jgi:hypothetical protein